MYIIMYVHVLIIIELWSEQKRICVLRAINDTLVSASNSFLQLNMWI